MAWSERNPALGGLRRWVQASGSLSARLAASGQRFTVQVVAQGRQSLGVDEARALGVGKQCTGYVREVVLRVDDRAMVFARSVTRHIDSRAAWKSVRDLGSRPLAHVLFSQRGIERQPLAFAKLPRSSPLQRHVARRWREAGASTLAHAPLIGRRSVFKRKGASLLVMEVFAAPGPQWRWTPQVASAQTWRA